MKIKNQRGLSNLCLFLMVGVLVFFTASSSLAQNNGTLVPVIPVISLLLVEGAEDPSEGKFIGTLSTDGEALDVVVKDDYAYVADGSNGLVVINISDPSNPTITTTLNEQAFSVEVFGSRLVIMNENRELLLVDISNPATPTITGNPFEDVSDHIGQAYLLLAFVNNVAFIMRSNDFTGQLFLMRVDFSDQNNPFQLSDIDDYNFILASTTNNLVLVSGVTGLHIYTAANATAVTPTVSDIFPAEQYSTGNYSKGNAAYVVTGVAPDPAPRLIAVINTSNLSDVSLQTTLVNPEPSSYRIGDLLMTGSDNIFYASMLNTTTFEHTGFLAIDNSSELAPTIIGGQVIQVPSEILAWDSIDERLFIVDGDGLNIYSPD